MSRRTTMMPMTSGGGRLRAVLALAAIVGLILVLRDPVGSAVAVEQMAAWVTAALDRLTQFVAVLSR
jgi:hypothetical protein